MYSCNVCISRYLILRQFHMSDLPHCFRWEYESTPFALPICFRKQRNSKVLLITPLPYLRDTWTSHALLRADVAPCPLLSRRFGTPCIVLLSGGSPPSCSKGRAARIVMPPRCMAQHACHGLQLHDTPTPTVLSAPVSHSSDRFQRCIHMGISDSQRSSTPATVCCL